MFMAHIIKTVGIAAAKNHHVVAQTTCARSELFQAPIALHAIVAAFKREVKEGGLQRPWQCRLLPTFRLL